MIQVDITGFEKVVSYMEAAKKSKFTVFRYGQSNANIPVFECLEHNNSQNAIQDFKKWAELANTEAVYRIVLFDIVEAGENGVVKKVGNKTGKMEAAFTLGQNAPINYSDSGKIDVSAIRAEITKQVQGEQEKIFLAEEIKKLREEVELLKSEEVDYEEEEGLFGVSSNQMQQLQQFILALKGGVAPAPVLNGAAAVVSKEEKLKILNEAIRRLYKVDKEIHSDLLLLADIAEQKPETFKYLINMLRGGTV